MVAVPIVESSQVGSARREAARLGARLGLDEVDLGRVALVVTELGSNLVRHAARGGEMIIDQYRDAGGTGLQILALDRGPGMADIQACLHDGYSTAGTPGTGLGAVIRLSDQWDMHSAPGAGTAILARIALRAVAPASSGAVLSWAGVCVPAPGEVVCGDAWIVLDDRRPVRLVVADGLGHGPLAAKAAAAVLTAASEAGATPIAALLRRMHDAAGPTRGAAAAVAQIEPESELVRFAGVGNIAGTIIAAGKVRRAVSHNGTLGHVVHRLQEFEYPYGAGSLLVLCSDGLVSSWSLEGYPGLLRRHPAVIAGILYRDFRRGRDDTTVVVVRHTGAAGQAE